MLRYAYEQSIAVHRTCSRRVGSAHGRIRHRATTIARYAILRLACSTCCGCCRTPPAEEEARSTEEPQAVTMAAQEIPAWRAWIWCLFCVGVPLLLHGAPYGTYVGPVALGYLPLPPQHAHLGLLAAGFTLWLAHTPHVASLPFPGRLQRLLTALLIAGMVFAAWQITHPSATQLTSWRQLPVWQGIAVTLTMYVLLLLPGMTSFGLLYPWSALRTCVRPLAACLGLAAGFVATGIVSTVWHGPLAAPALQLAGWLLRLVDAGATTVDAGAFIIGFRGFVTRVGPQCAALDGVLLFLLLAYACWRMRSAMAGLQAMLIGLMCATTLFFLNGVRIAGIMLIGSYNRTLGLDLFHGMAGMLLVLGMLWIFDRATVRTR